MNQAEAPAALQAPSPELPLEQRQRLQQPLRLAPRRWRVCAYKISGRLIDRHFFACDSCPKCFRIKSGGAMEACWLCPLPRRCCRAADPSQSREASFLLTWACSWRGRTLGPRVRVRPFLLCRLRLLNRFLKSTLWAEGSAQLHDMFWRLAVARCERCQMRAKMIT